MRVVVVGGGIFGVTAALALRGRGCEVTVVEPGPIPHPLAESTDISKIVRADYGADEDYTALGERALAGWRTWSARHLFHETGVAFLARAPMQPGGFEHDSFETLTRRGHRLERLDARAIAERFPAFRAGEFVDGYANPSGGWAASGAVVAHLAREAAAAGATFVADTATALDDTSVRLASGATLAAELVVVCSGAWAPLLVPALAPQIAATGQPVFHLAPRDPSLFAAERFPVFGADIARTGYYGFPLHDGVVKIANHGTGIPLAFDAPAEARVVTAAQEAALRAMLAHTLPALVDAPIVHRRICVYADTRDGDFVIARVPDRPRVVVATGGSGHAFKFAPVLGALIAAIALGESHPLAHRFRWRTTTDPARTEAARHR